MHIHSKIAHSFKILFIYITLIFQVYKWVLNEAPSYIKVFQDFGNPGSSEPKKKKKRNVFNKNLNKEYLDFKSF